MDSVTLLHDLCNRGEDIVGVLSVNYGQRHKLELEKAASNCKKLGLEHKIIDLSNLQTILKGSSLTDDVKTPEGHYEEENMKVTIVPNRNMILLSIASAYAASKDADFVAYGAHAGDHFIYWDCREDFIQALSLVTQMNEPKPIEIIAPYSKLTKVEILQIGEKIGVDYKDTWTCYNPQEGEVACGKCGSCQERLTAFKVNNLEDPLVYKTRVLIEKQ